MTETYGHLSDRIAKADRLRKMKIKKLGRTYTNKERAKKNARIYNLKVKKIMAYRLVKK